jgi:dTMP kinase
LKKDRGIFITIEGIEGVGKSSAVAYLKQYFQSQQLDFVITREPGGTEIAEAVRQIILQPHQELMSPDTELLLMFASRAQHIAKVIRPALAEGKIVVSDRFTDATYAYQGGGRGLSEARIATLEAWVQSDLQPDLTLLLDAPVTIGLERILQRGAKDRIEQEQIDFFQRVHDCYLKRAKQYPQRFKVIDATAPLAVVQNRLLETVSSFIMK